MTHTFEGFEKLGGEETLIISSHPEHASVTVIKPLRTWIEKSTGWPLKGEGSIQIATNADVKGTTTMSLARK